MLENNFPNVLNSDETTKFPEKKSVLNSPQDSDYSTNFANGSGMLTSTILGPESVDGKLDIFTQLNSQIAKIEGMFSSFSKNVTHEIELLKRMVEVKSTSNGDSKNNEKAVNSSERMWKFRFDICFY